MKAERLQYIPNSTRKMYMPIIVIEYCKYWKKWRFFQREKNVL